MLVAEKIHLDSTVIAWDHEFTEPLDETVHLPIPENFPTRWTGTHICVAASTASHMLYHDAVSVIAGGIDTLTAHSLLGTFGNR